MSRVDQALARAATAPVPTPDASGAGETPAVPWNLDDLPTAGMQSQARAADGAADAGAPPAVPWNLDDLPLETSANRAAPAAPPTVMQSVEDTRLTSRLSSDIAEKLVATAHVGAESVEEYRRLAAVLHLSQAERGLKVIMVASAQAGEGKTLTATNIALTLSESYRRSVLLVDADLRRPTLHDIFQVPNLAGLNDCLKGPEDRRLALIGYSEQLSVLPAGKPDPDPMSALTSDRMRRILAEAVTKFDWVILDTPPVGLLPDAHLLGSMVDGVVLVVQAGRTPHAAIQRTIDSLGRDRIVGVVLNRVDDVARQSKYDLYEYTSHASPDLQPRKRALWRRF